MTSTNRAFLSRSMMSASERTMGRFMRAPDDHTPAAPDAAAAEAAAAAAAAKPAAAESILFPKEADPAKPAGEVKDDKTPAAADWKEFTADPAKSEAENAAAKVEHDKTKPAAADPLDVVPEDGKYTLTMPEGVEVDQALVDALGPEFKDLKLTTKGAQRLADKFIEIQTGREKARGEAWGTTVAGWVDTAKADKEMGGDKWDGTVNTAVRAINTLGTPALKEYLEASGGGNHPELIRFMAKVGNLIKEDSPAQGGAEGAGKPVDHASLMFPNDTSKG